MRLRNWLLTGTSVAVFAVAPIGAARAQSAELQAAYQAYASAQASGDAAATQAALDALTELCIVEGYASVDECIAAAQAAAAPPPAEAPAPEPEPPQVEEPAPEPEPAPAEQPAAEQPPAAEEPAPEQPAAEEAPPAEEPAPAEPSGPTAEELQQQFVDDLNAALGQYQNALNQAAAGDYAGAQPVAAAAEARIQQLCSDHGYPSIEACIGQSLPPLPEPPAEEAAPAEEPAPAEQAAPAPEQPAAEQPATEPPAAEQSSEEQPATEPPAAEQPAAEQPAEEQPAETDPLVQAQSELQTAVELYNVGVSQLQSGDTDGGNATIEAANAQIGEICASLGFTDVTECLSNFGYTLPPLPEAPPAEQPPAEPPIAELPGADEAVTPDAVEVLPTEIAPEEAAPILDSAKDAAVAPVEATEGQPAEQPAEQPAAEAAPPPATDTEAQAALARPAQVVPVEEVRGEAVAIEALPPVEVPRNVTIVNNITNITNVTNVTNNTTNVTNNNFTNTGFILQVGVNLVIDNPAQERDRYYDPDEDEVYYERLPGGRTKETVVRPNGVKIVTIRNRYGDVLRKSRIMPNGREYILAYYDEDEEDDDRGEWRDPGLDLPPLRLTIPVREYILDADEADEDEVEEFLREPPVERVRRIYTIDEVKHSARIRDSVRRLEVGGLTFDTGAATISRSQVGALSKVANAMLALLEDNPAETFLIEGHTDAVGSEVSNLVLSDARAATVARILTDFYDIPPENLVTQGYGERFLKVKTERAERLNRRVTIKRITPLITLTSADDFDDEDDEG